MYTKEHFNYDSVYGIAKEAILTENIELNKEKYSLLEKDDIVIDSLSKKAVIVKATNKGMFVAFNYFILKPKIEINKHCFVLWFNLSLSLNE